MTDQTNTPQSPADAEEHALPTPPDAEETTPDHSSVVDEAANEPFDAEDAADDQAGAEGSDEDQVDVADAAEDSGVVEGDGGGSGEGVAVGVLGEDEEHLPPGQTEVPVGDEVVVDDDTMRRALEAILMVTDEPLPVLTMARAVGRPTGDVAEALGELAAEYTEQGRGFDLREVGGGWRYYTRAEAAPYVERFVLDGQQARLTQAALETLSVVAYKQPVSRARVSAIRGVNVDGVMRTLVARGLVEEAGADTESQATLYRTTSYFLERMGMQSLDDLPELAPYLPDMDDIEEELAAQTLPPTPTEDPTPPENAEPADATSNATSAEDAENADLESTEPAELADVEDAEDAVPAEDAEQAEYDVSAEDADDAESGDSGAADVASVGSVGQTADDVEYAGDGEYGDAAGVRSEGVRDGG
ncbi:SMC-Scp complex subunit ScpB [Kribbella sp. NBC_00662]|uniref:SMC-Scp complex subunit ScpB n=1 Tax=Kribbella sp. NBC_00662 TaxID=2975969 RepID=UPI00352A97CC